MKNSMKIMLAAFLMLLFQMPVAAKLVKFSVNMKGVTVKSTGIHISGDFQTAAGFPDGDWNSASTAMTARKDNPDIYEVTVNIPAFRKYEFKFVNGDLFYEVEFVPEESRVGYDFVDNRWFYLDSLNNDTTYIGPLMFGGNAPEGKKLLRFRVGMNSTTVAAAGVHVSGSFNANSYTATRMYSFNGSVFDAYTYVDSGTTVSYLYVNGNNSGGEEVISGACANAGKRSSTVSADLVLDSLCFSSCDMCKTTSIGELTAKADWKVYPNPVHQTMYIEFPQGFRSEKLEVYNLQGESMLSRDLNAATQTTVDVSVLPAGIYFVECAYLVKRIVITHP